MVGNFLQPGDVVTLTAPTGGVVSGNGYVVGALFVIAMGDAAQTVPFEGALTGVSILPKASGAIDEGAKVWWDTSPGNVVNATQAGAFPIGTAVAAAGVGDTTVNVRLDGVAVVAAGA